MSYQNRINHIREFCKQSNIDAVFITSPTNLSYFSGFIPLDVTEREAYLLITKSHAYIFTSALYADEVKTYVTDYELIEVTADSPLSKQLFMYCKNDKVQAVGFEERNLTYLEHKKLQKKSFSLIPIDINHLRIKKDSEEISFIQQACSIGDQAFSNVLGNIKPGITEKELAFALELYMRKQQTMPSFPTIVGFGKNAAIPHHVTGDTQLKKNEFVLMDFGVKYNNYCSDMTRTVFLGTPSSEEKKLYSAVYTSQQTAIDFIQQAVTQKKPIKASDADLHARNYLTQHGFPSFPHSLGHGIGLQVHELPSLSPYSIDVLESGMVFSIEPGIYKPSRVGIRIEDLATLENDSLTLLTKSPRELILL